VLAFPVTVRKFVPLNNTLPFGPEIVDVIVGVMV
jgi:hypothetical protein